MSDSDLTDEERVLVISKKGGCQNKYLKMELKMKMKGIQTKY